MAAVAQLSNQHDVHPLLRHPRPITGDFAKAQRMLGLIADSEENTTTLRREKSKTTKWLERPLYAHLDVSDIESEKEEEFRLERGKIAQSTNEASLDERSSHHCISRERPTSFYSENSAQSIIEPKSRSDVSFVKRRPEPLRSLRPVSYNPQDLLSPQWTASPATMSPNTQHDRPASLQFNRHNMNRGSISSISSSGSVQRMAHPQTWPNPSPQLSAQGRAERPTLYQPPWSATEQYSPSSPNSPHTLEQRPRPTSFASYQHRDRRNSKIASSRGLRNNSYPNFSRPNPGSTPKAIPGESLEGGFSHDSSVESQSGPSSATFSGFVANNDIPKDEKKTKNRWSAIANPLKKFTRRRSSAASAEPNLTETLHTFRQMNITDQDIHPYDVHAAGNIQVAPIITSPTTKPLPTPSYSPLDTRQPNFEAELPKPFAPWAQAPPSPALSHDKRRSCDISRSPRRRRASSLLSIENVVESRPESYHSRESSLASLGMPSPVRHIPLPQPRPMFDSTASSRTGSRRGTPVVERSCIICKTAKEPDAFASRRISGNCWHEPATCYQCLKAHIEACVAKQGWDHCSCPECGEVMTYEDMGAFADDDNSFVKWED